MQAAVNSGTSTPIPIVGGCVGIIASLLRLCSVIVLGCLTTRLSKKRTDGGDKGLELNTVLGIILWLDERRVKWCAIGKWALYRGIATSKQQ